MFTICDLQIMGNTSCSTLLLLFPSIFIINTSASQRVKMDDEKHLDSKTAYHHGAQYIIAIQQCIKGFTGHL
jgi:hypothetical protein